MALTDEEWKIAIEEKISQLKNTDNDGTVAAHTGGTQTKFITITHPSDPLFPSTIDHTLLKPDATSAQIDVLCYEAIRYGFKSCCVNGVHVKQVAERLRGSKSIPCAVIGFPLGASTTAVKVFEAQDAIFNGAREIDMVINIGALKSQSYTTVFDDIRAVAEACHSSLTQPSEEAMRKVNLKVILETIFLSDSEKIAGAFIAAEAGADFVKTCTGFGGGGATKEDVGLLYRSVEYTSGRNDGKGDKVKVKASAGIRSFEKCVEMLGAGAERVGTSSGVAIMQNMNVGTVSGTSQTSTVSKVY
ncbi:hypothetical protein F5876DRAFT_31071 [Lentinula aff. lateritia]|uniref:Uncharacterized protein n=1 Tax=Lentinula aff. lateritia TaxID=2804960 RepID=A0ACC1UEZ2_9AGAR|nr:hypothetical protein F5876DRAFT_31071 [Lentinula aff. lateritia]